MSIGTIVAARTGFFFGWLVVFGLIGPVFAGWMYDQTESYRLSFVVLAAVGFLAPPMILSLRRPAEQAAAGPA